MSVVLTACGGKTGAGPCDAAPTGVARTVARLPFTVPAGLMPDPRLDGLPAELAVHVVKPLYAHGRCAGGASQVAVLIHGRVLSAAPTFDLRGVDQRGETLSVQEELAKAGIDTYAPDLLGYGGSTHFEKGLDDPCNASLPSDRTANPIFPLGQQGKELGHECAHSSGVRFGRTDVWARDIRQVIEFAVEDAHPDGGEVVLVGYSVGGLRIGRALDQDAGKVSRAIFVSSLFGGPTEEPSPPPEITFPLALWRAAKPAGDPPECEGRTVPGSDEKQWQEALASDPVGKTWGVVRYPTFSTHGWNPEVAGRVRVPALILQGLDDETLGRPPLLGPKSACAIYDALRPPKVVVRVGCASHRLLIEGCAGGRCKGWGGPHATVTGAMIEWVKHGTFESHASGSFVVDGSGATTDATCPM